MPKQKNKQHAAKPTSYYVWVGVFILLVIVVSGLFYYRDEIEEIKRITDEGWDRL